MKIEKNKSKILDRVFFLARKKMRNDSEAEASKKDVSDIRKIEQKLNNL